MARHYYRGISPPEHDQSPAKSFIIQPKPSATPIIQPASSAIEINTPLSAKQQPTKLSDLPKTQPKKPEIQITARDIEPQLSEPMVIVPPKKEEKPVEIIEKMDSKIDEFTNNKFQDEQGEISMPTRGKLEEIISDLKEEMHREFMNMHVEMIRQFQIQIVFLCFL